METSRIRSDREGPQIYHPKADPESGRKYTYYGMHDEDESNAFIEGLEIIGRVGIFVFVVASFPIWGLAYGTIWIAKKIIRGR